MTQFARSIAVLLLSAGLMQGAVAQGIFKGFIPDENGTNLDAPQPIKIAPSTDVTPATVVKTCAECPEMVVIPAGSFVMGSNNSSVEQPTHSVNLRSFLMGKTEVTQGQWEAVMGHNPSKNKGLMLPVENVSWNEVQQFIAKLNTSTRQKYRLPSEAEWEYAARAGTTTDWSFGDDESKLWSHAWYSANSGGTTQAVGQKLPNAFGLFDVHGSVWEWTRDCWHENYAGAPTDGSAWTTGCTGNHRVLRGGSWWYGPASLRSAKRIGFVPDLRGSYGIGFRLARDL